MTINNDLNIDKPSASDSREEYIKKQRKKIAVSLILLVAVSVLMLTWKIYNADQQLQEKQQQQRSEQVQNIQSNLDNSSNLAIASPSTVAQKQQAILAAITKDQSLPVKIDDISAIDNIYFNSNALTFEVALDNKNIPAAQLEKLRNQDVINNILQKNKPVACSIMNQLKGWEGNWTIRYIYYLANPREQIGNIEFSPSKC